MRQVALPTPITEWNELRHTLEKMLPIWGRDARRIPRDRTTVDPERLEIGRQLLEVGCHQTREQCRCDSRRTGPTCAHGTPRSTPPMSPAEANWWRSMKGEPSS